MARAADVLSNAGRVCVSKETELADQMGWDRERYEAICKQCGKSGVVIESSDEWGRYARHYEGFENLEPDVNAVGRLRQDRRQMHGRCTCGSTSIVTGKRLLARD